MFITQWVNLVMQTGTNTAHRTYNIPHKVELKYQWCYLAMQYFHFFSFSIVSNINFLSAMELNRKFVVRL